ncbi:copper resistance CopC family protein [Billgrantia lactosivorans]|uniref:copper resistance CopC family protein n=1 Tax=Billgrantia lactosivorans TaxID=2185141 RepID=UPI000DACFC1E|nr:copper resistance CopC family protein [Halomonas lactosivorans]
MGGETKASGAARAARRVGRWGGLAAAVWLLAASPLLWAHAHVGDTYPEDGATLEQPPERLELQFDAPIRLTRYEVTGPQGAVALGETPLGQPTQAHIAVPAQPLPPGEYEVEWRGLAEDGHSMSGGYRFTVRE